MYVNPPVHYNLNQLARNFSEYIEAGEQELLLEFPFLAQLADSEWIELEVLEKDVDIPESRFISTLSQEELLVARLVLNETLIFRPYKYSFIEIVQSITAEDWDPVRSLDIAQVDTWVLGCRDRLSHVCHFMLCQEQPPAKALRRKKKLAQMAALSQTKKRYDVVIILVCGGERFQI